MRAATLALIALGLSLALPHAADAAPLSAPPSWYPALKWSPAASANFDVGRAGTKITSIVIHATDGTYAGTISWFKNPATRLSAHYVIRASDGEITQTVSEADTAFHARGFNRPSIGIEHEWAPRHGIGYTAAQYRSSAALVCAIARRYSIPLDRAHVLGHDEVAGSDHADPGASWDWAYYMGLLRSCGTPAPGLGFGDQGEAVGQLQDALTKLGWLAASDVAGGRGRFGPRTLAALVAFQRANGVPATGFYGTLSAAALSRGLTQGAVPGADLSLGDESAAVADLQRALSARGYMNVVTGYFGPVTREAVRRFQRDHGIIATGYYGPLTRAALALH